MIRQPLDGQSLETAFRGLIDRASDIRCTLRAPQILREAEFSREQLESTKKLKYGP